MNNNIGKRDILIFHQFKNVDEFSTFTYEFQTIVDEVSIELIGEHDESIIIKNIRLGD